MDRLFLAVLSVAVTSTAIINVRMSMKRYLEVFVGVRKHSTKKSEKLKRLIGEHKEG